MLEEAVAIIRELWTGELVTHDGDYYSVHTARLYTVPDEPPPIMVAAAGPMAAGVAGRIGDGLISVAPDDSVVKAFRRDGGEGKPVYGQLQGCWAASRDDAVKTVLKQWPNAGIQGAASQELPLPEHFSQLAQNVKPDDLGEMPLGPDAEPWLEQVKAYGDAGVTHVYLHQIGSDQEGFLDFARRELLPQLS
jgi:G6PDH family F420-dependent oxidoreductase